MNSNKKKMPAEQKTELLQTLKVRFDKNMSRHSAVKWAEIEEKLGVNPAKLWALYEMEATGGEPDVIAKDKKNR